MIAAGRLTDVLRRVADVRRHAGATRSPAGSRAAHRGRRLRCAGGRARTSTRALDEHARQTIPRRQLTGGDVRLDDLPITTADEHVRDVLDTFRTAAHIHPESLGAYVITMASAPSDVLAVEFLQMAAGTSHPQRVVPLFETAARSASGGRRSWRDLLALPWYRDRIGDQQEVMIGYSDSAEGRGPLERRLGAVPRAGRRRRRVRSARRAR